jgi:hypothetical protein
MDTQNKTTPEDRATTRTRKKSVWRLIGGGLILGAAANSLRQMPNNLTFRHDLTSVITYLVFDLLVAAIGVWLVVSYLRRGRNRSDGAGS